MFASKAFAVMLVAAVCRAVPVWIGEAWRDGRSPSVAFGIGSGFSSDFGGIRHSSGYGASFQSGNGRAFGSGYGSAGGDVYAQGIGFAKAAPAYPQPSPQIQPIYNHFGSASSTSQNYGAGSSSAQSHSNVQFPAVRALPFFNTAAAVSSAHTSRGPGYDSAAAAAQSGSTLGYNTAVSAAERAGDDYNAAISAAESHDGVSDYGSTVSFVQDSDGVQASAAEALQRHGGRLQQTGASSFNAPGLQVSHAHSVNTGGYF